ncbi:hypothetical protein V8E36_004725, partial [Tilletia maclaganii]
RVAGSSVPRRSSSVLSWARFTEAGRTGRTHHRREDDPSLTAGQLRRDADDGQLDPPSLSVPSKTPKIDPDTAVRATDSDALISGLSALEAPSQRSSSPPRMHDQLLLLPPQHHHHLDLQHSARLGAFARRGARQAQAQGHEAAQIHESPSSRPSSRSSIAAVAAQTQPPPPVDRRCSTSVPTCAARPWIASYTASCGQVDKWGRCFWTRSTYRQHWSEERLAILAHPGESLPRPELRLVQRGRELHTRASLTTHSWTSRRSQRPRRSHSSGATSNHRRR